MTISAILGDRGREVISVTPQQGVGGAVAVMEGEASSARSRSAI